MRRTLILIFICFLMFFLGRSFNLKNSITYFLTRNSDSQLFIKLEDKSWGDLKKLSANSLKRSIAIKISDDFFSCGQLIITRRLNTPIQKINHRLNPSKINIVEFSPENFEFFASYFKYFKPATAKQMVRKDTLCFAINANLFENDFTPRGLIISRGEVLNEKYLKFKGYFFVKNGRPYAGPESLYRSISGRTEEAVQAGPAIMKNHQVFHYIVNSKGRYFYTGELNFRSLVGMKDNGNIVFIISDNGGIVSFQEIGIIAKKLGVKHATALDGGAALQYHIKYKSKQVSFHAFNNNIPFPGKLKMIRQRSPVYIGVKLRNEQSNKR